MQNLNYIHTSNDEDADLFLFNVCSVTKKAEDFSKKHILKILQKNPDSKIAIIGFFDDNYKKYFYEKYIEFFKNLIFLTNKDELIDKLIGENVSKESCKEIDNFEGHTRAFVKIQDGCNNFCSYCIIPYLRGRSRSRPIDEIIQEVNKLVENGYKEIVLTGINIGDFKYKDKTLKDLLYELEKINLLKRVRISSINPDDLNDDLLLFIINSKKIQPHLHISIQSGSDKVLKKMNRRYTIKYVIDLMAKIKKYNQEFFFSTDIIVGYPDETEEAFNDSLKLVDENDFIKVHAFPFSPRKNTYAYKLKLLPNEIVRERKKTLTKLYEEKFLYIKNEFYKKNDTHEILLEKYSDSFLCGYTSNYMKIFIENTLFHPNDLVRVKIIKNEKIFFGKVIKKL